MGMTPLVVTVPVVPVLVMTVLVVGVRDLILSGRARIRRRGMSWGLLGEWRWLRGELWWRLV